MFELKKISVVFLMLLIPCFCSTLMAQKTEFFVGTYTSEGGSKGIQQYDFEPTTGKSIFRRTINMENPSFLARKGEILYAVNENYEGKVTAVDLRRGKVLGLLPTQGAHPCHVALSPIQPVLVVSNYTGGSLTLFSLKEDGGLDKQEDFIQFTGYSINKERQSASHIHSAFFSADGSRLFVSDLGADLIYIYQIVEKDSGFGFHRVDSIRTKKGGGPRHVVVADGGRCIYSVLELTGELEVFQQKNGNWESTQILPIYKKEFIGEHGGADIKMSSDGKFVYATNRGDANVVACYQVLRDKNLRLKSVIPTGGNSPRNLNISEDGKWVFVTNQISNEITVFERNTKTGKLRPDQGSPIETSKPVCLIF